MLVLLAICCLVIVASNRLGHATTLALSGLVAPQGRPDWPHGIQEMDAPQFEVAHLDALRPGTPVLLDGPAIGGAADPDEPQPEVVELFDRPLRGSPGR